MIKNEKGSITVFVLCACLLVLVVLIAIFTRNQNKIINQKKELQIIEEKYNADSKIDQIYDETLQNINGGENTTEVVKIATANDLKNFAVSVNNGDTYEGKIVVLMNDIDLSSICSSTNGVSWTPIGNGTTAFSGTFDGRNYTISNLYILTEGGDNQALFRDNNGVIKNLKMQNAYVKSMRNSDTGLYEKYGLLCASNNGEIISCSILSGEFIDSNAGQKYAGGITGYNTGKISKCYNSATNKVYTYGGGIAGYNSGTIESCYNTAIIGNYSDHGGIVG